MIEDLPLRRGSSLSGILSFSLLSFPFSLSLSRARACSTTCSSRIAEEYKINGVGARARRSLRTEARKYGVDGAQRDNGDSALVAGRV